MNLREREIQRLLRHRAEENANWLAVMERDREQRSSFRRMHDRILARHWICRMLLGRELPPTSEQFLRQVSQLKSALPVSRAHDPDGLPAVWDLEADVLRRELEKLGWFGPQTCQRSGHS